jgi:hypothetical protein
LLYDGQGYWLLMKEALAGALHLVAPEPRRTRAPVGSRAHHCAVERRSRAGSDGPRLAPRRLR